MKFIGLNIYENVSELQILSSKEIKRKGLLLNMRMTERMAGRKKERFNELDGKT